MAFGPLVDAAWLGRALDQGRPELVLADVRWYPNRDARAAFEEGHVPGAIFVDVDRDLAGPVEGESGRHPLPAPEAFAEAMSRLGIADSARVVAYDDVSGSVAARLWWMLSVTGHQVAVLDGGFRAWEGAVETGPPRERPRARFTARPWPADRIVGPEEVDQLRIDPSALVLDARAGERYRGEVEPIDPVAGHIPGARSAPWSENLDPATGRFLPPEDLRGKYEAKGAGGRSWVAAYCGSGITSCHDLLAMEVAGLPTGKLFVGSWSGWVADRSRPVARGPEP
jgi:thiosulfate/3-mercaptopyruvate sulfurtransferase